MARLLTNCASKSRLTLRHDNAGNHADREPDQDARMERESLWLVGCFFIQIGCYFTLKRISVDLRSS